MTVYVTTDESGQKLKSEGHELSKEDWKDLKGKEIKNVQKMDGVIMFTLK